MCATSWVSAEKRLNHSSALVLRLLTYSGTVCDASRRTADWQKFSWRSAPRICDPSAFCHSQAGTALIKAISADRRRWSTLNHGKVYTRRTSIWWLTQLKALSGSVCHWMLPYQSRKSASVQHNFELLDLVPSTVLKSSFDASSATKSLGLVQCLEYGCLVSQK